MAFLTLEETEFLELQTIKECYNEHKEILFDRIKHCFKSGLASANYIDQFEKFEGCITKTIILISSTFTAIQLVKFSGKERVANSNRFIKKLGRFVPSTTEEETTTHSPIIAGDDIRRIAAKTFCQLKPILTSFEQDFDTLDPRQKIVVEDFAIYYVMVKKAIEQFQSKNPC